MIVILKSWYSHYPGVLWSFKTIWECNERLKAIAIANEPVRYCKKNKKDYEETLGKAHSLVK